jgi:hypothetical protein
MAIASPSLQVAALAAMNPPDSFVAPVLFPRCAVPGAAMKPGENEYKATAYRVTKNNNRSKPGEVSLEMQPGHRPNRIYSTLEDYAVSSKVYEVDHPVSDYARPTLEAFGITNYAADVAMPEVMETLRLDRERRAVAFLSNTANFGGNTAGTWGDDNNDPIEQLDAAIRSILLGFGTPSPEQGHALDFVLSDDAWRAFRNNAKVRARFKITEDTPVLPSELSGFITKVLAIGDNPLPVRIRVSYAQDGGGANEGQTFTPAFLLANKAALVVSCKASTIPLASIPGSGAIAARAQSELRWRSWGRGYSMLDPTIKTIELEDTSELIFRGVHATTDTLYDATGGYLWTAPASS